MLHHLINLDIYSFPHYYQPMLTPAEQTELTRDIADNVARFGFNPIAASLTGSRLRGLDTTHSDTDAVVFVAEQRREEGEKYMFRLRKQYAETYMKQHMPDVDVQIRDFNELITHAGTSVPYMGVLNSHGLLIDHHSVAAMLPHLYVPYRQADHHIQRFTLHTATRGVELNNDAHNQLIIRGSQSLAKKCRIILACYHLAATGSALCPRHAFYTDTALHNQTATWLENAMYQTTTKHNPDVVKAVATHLRNHGCSDNS